MMLIGIKSSIISVPVETMQDFAAAHDRLDYLV